MRPNPFDPAVLPAKKDVIPVIPEENVQSFVPIQDVETIHAKKNIVRQTTGDEIVTDAPNDCVRARGADEATSDRPNIPQDLDVERGNHAARIAVAHDRGGGIGDREIPVFNVAVTAILMDRNGATKIHHRMRTGKHRPIDETKKRATFSKWIPDVKTQSMAKFVGHQTVYAILRIAEIGPNDNRRVWKRTVDIFPSVQFMLESGFPAAESVADGVSRTYNDTRYASEITTRVIGFTCDLDLE